jgi:hypothetical protein
VATLLVLGDLVLPLMAQAVVVAVAVAATNVVVSPINRIAATSIHLPPPDLSAKFALRLVILSKPDGIAMTMIPLSLALQVPQPQVPLRTRGTLILGQHTILLTILTN